MLKFSLVFANERNSFIISPSFIVTFQTFGLLKNPFVMWIGSLNYNISGQDLSEEDFIGRLSKTQGVKLILIQLF